MRVLSEEKIVVTRTTYGFDDTEEHGPWAVESVKIKVESDGQPVFEKRIAEHLLRKQPERCSPVECFIDYIQALESGQSRCSKDAAIRREVMKIFNEIYDSDNKLPIPHHETAVMQGQKIHNYRLEGPLTKQDIIKALSTEFESLPNSVVFPLFKATWFCDLGVFSI